MKAVLDLECTCDEPQFPRNEMEIIEIGAVIIDDILISLINLMYL